MREILFKAQSVDNGEWVFGLLEEDDHYNFYISFYDIDRAKNLIKIKPETLSQFTGLKDKNGKEIFENDIVKVECLYDYDKRFNGNTIVKFCLGRFEFVFDSNYFNDVEEAVYLTTNIMNNYSIEVIGNKFDNPEIVEVSDVKD